MLIIQFTGLSGGGKTTISTRFKQLMEQQNHTVEIIDGDTYRNTLCKDLGFSKADRQENIRRLGKVAAQLAPQTSVVIIAAINPYQQVRHELKTNYGVKTVWINCDIDELLKRDTKGLYKRALLPNEHPNKIYNLTGINDTYDAPIDHDLQINTHIETLQQSVDKLMDFVKQYLE
ncbi:MAG: adenylyl-sulfate kinase [Mucilaginibacter sp.]|uniref:adenylyl-sulfate kinase n=1 Tax=Mucilaginibacter sp. TaxID=1882438 RepID=UPI00326317EF